MVLFERKSRTEEIMAAVMVCSLCWQCHQNTEEYKNWIQRLRQYICRFWLAYFFEIQSCTWKAKGFHLKHFICDLSIRNQWELFRVKRCIPNCNWRWSLTVEQVTWCDYFVPSDIPFYKTKCWNDTARRYLAFCHKRVNHLRRRAPTTWYMLWNYFFC